MLNITGNPGKEEEKIHAIAKHIRADRPLRHSTFERYINVLGILPGIKVAANVPPQNADGARRAQQARAAGLIRGSPIKRAMHFHVFCADQRRCSKDIQRGIRRPQAA